MRKYFKFKLAVMSVCLFAFLSFPALAEDDASVGSPHFYATANVGYSKLDADFTGWTDVDDTDTAYSVGIGYGFNDYVAIEAGWLDIGKASASTSASGSGTLYGKPFSYTGNLSTEYEADGFYIDAIVSPIVVEKFKAYAKVGVYFWDMDAEASASASLTYDGTTYAANAKADASQSGEDLFFGFGLSYDITENLTVRTDWTRYDVSDADIDVFAVGIVFKFGKLF